MGLPVEINPLFVSSTGGYTVGRSLRFRASASAYLSRTIGTPSTTTNTFSAWVKRGDISAAYRPILMCTNNNSGINYQLPSTSANDTIQILDNGTTLLATSAVYRDPSAWYHIVVVWDSTNATSTDRVRLYVNGFRVTAFGTTNYPVLNAAFSLFSASNPWQIGSRQFPGALYFDGYMAEINYIDGQALTASSFGAYDTNGVWQPAKYAGTYGTNGFYLPFSNTSSTTTLVADASGNGNNWTPNNISLTAGATYDSMIDSPSNATGTSYGVGNYAVFSPLDKGSNLVVANANLNVSIGGTGGNDIGRATMAFPTSGKWYFEMTVAAVGAGVHVGLATASVVLNSGSGTFTGIWYNQDGTKTTSWGSSVAYGATYTTNDVIGVAYDSGANSVTFYKNNVSQGAATPSSTGAEYFPAVFLQTTANVNLNFGQRPFTYTPPTGYSALNTYNLPAATINNGALYNAATLYTGSGASQTISNSASSGGNNPLGKTFYPDFVWIKDRTNISNHAALDSVRPSGFALYPNLTSAESDNSSLFTGITSTGFSVAGTNITYNQASDAYVAWQWKAGAGSSSTNTSGTITSTVSASASSGFSVVTYTGTGANATVGHGLGVAPSMIIIKNRQAANSWVVYHVSTGNGNVLLLNSTNASTADSTAWNTTTPTSSVFSLGSGAAADTNQTTGGGQHVAYCFAAVRGYSAFGSYTGNGSTDGPFTYLGFRPRFIMIKRTDTTMNWYIFDTSRDTYNVEKARLFPNLSDAELTNADFADYLSNGFKLRSSDISWNASGGTYIYAAFAENPFNISRAR